MQIVKDKITVRELKKTAQKMFGNLIKAVVDVEKKIMAIDMELHADGEQWLLEKGSQQNNLWGINLYPDLTGKDWIEFDSMINLRPSQNNRTRGIDDNLTKSKIIKIVDKLTAKD